MITAIALDDEPLALNIIETYCKMIDSVQLEKSFNKQSDALKYLNKFPVDLIFLDVEMPNQSGLEFSKNIPEGTKIIFTTAFYEYAVRAFEVNAVDYLLKPFSLERFCSAIEKVKTSMVTQESKFLSIRADYKLYRIDFDEVLLIEGSDDYVKIHLKGGERIIARSSMKNIQTKLPAEKFLRVHRSYIVPVKSIRKMLHKNLHIEDFIIPVGETYREIVADFLK